MTKTLPTFLAILFSVAWFYPSFQTIPGWGGDPYFVVWIFETVWKQIDAFGLMHLFSDAFWKASIFHPMPLTFAFSENELYAALIGLPIRFITGSSAFTIGLLCFSSSLAAFIFATKWLQSIGVKTLHTWGGLLFCACGWIQSQYAHIQNIWIFLFPLALLMWNRWEKSQRLFDLICCACAFGWMGGFNLYYQVFANLIFAGLWIHRFRKFPNLRKSLIYLALLTVLFELPIAWKYIEAQLVTRAMGISNMTFTALPESFLLHTNHSSLLQRLIPFYPHPQADIEADGFLGVTWVFLLLIAFRVKAARPWILISLFFYWISLGPVYGLVSLLNFFPGVSALRSIGRAQLFVALFSLPAILIFLESQIISKRTQSLLLGMLILELIPGELAKRTEIPIDTNITKLIQSLPEPTTPALICPTLDSRDQMLLNLAPFPIYSGYSGREPLGVALLTNYLQDHLTPKGVTELYEYMPFQRVVSIHPSCTQVLHQVNWLKAMGCTPTLGREWCVFDVVNKPQTSSQYTKLRLDRDSNWEEVPLEKGHQAVLKMSRAGMLDFKLLSRCQLNEEIKFPLLPAFSTSQVLPKEAFNKISYQQGEQVLEFVSKQAIFSLPKSIRPTKKYRIHCFDSEL